MLLEQIDKKKNAFDLKEWKRCHSNWRVIDVVSSHVCGWQWVTITARWGHGSTFTVFQFNNKEVKSWWKSNERYFWRKKYLEVIDGKLFFGDGWSCTDPDNHQFCHVINSHTFRYIQLKETSSFYDGAEHSKNLLDELDGKTTIKDWYEDEIDVNDFSEDEIKEAIEPYGGILDNVTSEQDRNQLIAECSFEQLTME